MELSDLLSRYRKDSGMTIDELAAKSNVPKGTLTKILGGVTKAPTLDTVQALARALGKTLADFDADQASTEAEDPLWRALLLNFSQLNTEGQERLVEMSDDMVASGKYIKTHSTGLGGAQA